MQLFYIYFVMPEFGVTLSALQASIIGLGIAYSAYQAENFRAGIEAIDKGQIEASESLGMGWALMMRRVVLPQAVKIILPPYGNIMIMMLKDSSQASTITVAELTLKGQLIASSTFKYTSVLTHGRGALSRHERAADPVRRLAGAAHGAGAVMIELSERAQELWRRRGAARHHGQRRPRRGRVHHRPVRLGQVDDPALHQRARRL